MHGFFTRLAEGALGLAPSIQLDKSVPATTQINEFESFDTSDQAISNVDKNNDAIDIPHTHSQNSLNEATTPVKLSKNLSDNLSEQSIDTNLAADNSSIVKQNISGIDNGLEQILDSNDKQPFQVHNNQIHNNQEYDQSDNATLLEYKNDQTYITQKKYHNSQLNQKFIINESEHNNINFINKNSNIVKNDLIDQSIDVIQQDNDNSQKNNINQHISNTNLVKRNNTVSNNINKNLTIFERNDEHSHKTKENIEIEVNIKNIDIIQQATQQSNVPMQPTLQSTSSKSSLKLEDYLRQTGD